MKNKIIIYSSIIIVILLAISGYLIIKNKHNSTVQNINIVTNENINLENKVIENEIKDIRESNKTIEEYIESIYPVKVGDTFPEFDTIQNADDYWIWSTAFTESGIKDMGTTFSKKKNIVETAKKLYGNEVPEFPQTKETLDKLDIHYNEKDDTYSWIGNSRSIPTESNYIITSKTEKENNIIEVEIAEYLVYEWSEPYVLIEDIDGNVFVKFKFNTDYTNSEELEEKKKNYIENNINNFDKKLLTIKLDRRTGLYHILSSKSI